MDLRVAQKRLLFFPLTILLGAGNCFAQTTIHVPSDVATIQGAINQAQNGDTIMVSPGTYNENLKFDGKSITVTTGAKSYTDAAVTTTVIKGMNNGPVVTFQSGEPPTTVLNGFTIQNAHGSSGSPVLGGGIAISNASPTVTNNLVTKNYGCGIMIINNSASPLVQGNDINGNLYTANIEETDCEASPSIAAASGAGVFIANAGNVQFIGNVVENNATNPANDAGGTESTGAGVTINAQTSLFQNNIIRNNYATLSNGLGTGLGAPIQKLMLINNLIYGNVGRERYDNSDQVGIVGPYSGSGPPLELTEINNTIYGGEALTLYFGPSTIANNIFYNASNVGFMEQNAGLNCADPPAANSPLTINNNDIFNTETLEESGCTLGSGNIAVDPALRDPANGDFHEQASSPTVAAGDINASQVPHADLDNKARIVCNTVDMGAYELRPHPPIALTSSLNPAPGGSSITFTAALTGNCNVPTGIVTFLDGGQSIGTGILNGSGVATLTTSFLVVGQHQITTTYPGDFNFDSSTSDVLIQTITGDPSFTALSVSPNPAAAYSPITLQGYVTSPYGTPTGQVSFFAGPNPVATAALDAAGRATAVVSTLGAGIYAMTAHYGADTRFQPSISPAIQETVYGANTATTLNSSLNPAAATQTVTFTVSVRATQGSTHTPSGTVTLFDGGNLLGTAQLTASGTASFASKFLSYGVHTITARYGGSGDFNPSSATLSESVTLIGTSISLSVTPNPANAGQMVTITATAATSVPGAATIGMVTFRDGTTVLGTAAIGGNAAATFTTSALAVGTHPLQASFSGNADLAGSVSQVVNEVVQAYGFTVQSSKTAISLPSGDWTEVPVTIAPLGGFKGTVQLSCNNLPNYALCTFPNGGSVSLTSGPKTIQMVLSASDVYGYGKEKGQTSTGESSSYLAIALMPPFGLLCFARRRRSVTLCITLFVVGIALLLGMQGCSGKWPSKTAPGTYLVTLSGTSGGNSPQVGTTTIQLSVTP